MQNEAFEKELELLIRSRYPLIWIESWEEERALAMISSIAQRMKKPKFVWDVNDGLRGAGSVVGDSENGRVALQHVADSKENGLFVLLDFHPYIKDGNPRTIRQLRSTAKQIQKSFKTLIIISPVAEIPVELEKVITLLTLPLPDEKELNSQLETILESVSKNKNLEMAVNDKLKESMVKAARGLTLDEAEKIFIKAAVSDRRIGPEDLSLILSEKKQILRKTGMLEYFETDLSMKQVGGLDRLKLWLGDRTESFSEKARKFGLPQPKGLLLLGVQGCGKSMVAKAIAQMWQIPLLKLDMGALFSSYIGSTEANMRKAIALAESISPVVLWIDEIEKGLSGLESSGSVDAGVTARVFGSFLSWMQEKTSPVFVVATSNDVRKIPPELLRKGRFDEIFFVDLPSEKERQDIFQIHISLKQRKPDNFDLQELAQATDGFSGAEIEQAIISALYTAFSREQELSQKLILEAVSASIPLSKTMSENIAGLRAWAEKRTVKAS